MPRNKQVDDLGRLLIILEEKESSIKEQIDESIKANNSYTGKEKERLSSALISVKKEIISIKNRIGKLEKSDNKQPQETVKESSKVILKGVLWEQVYNNKTGVCQYVSWQNGKYVYATTLKDEERKITFITQCEQIDWVEGEGIVFPEKPVDYVSFKELLNSLETFIREYLQIPDERVRINAYYVILTWLTEKTNTIPYLQCIGMPGAGKSRFTEVFGGICCKAITLLTPRANHVYRLLTTFPESTLVVNEDFGKNKTQSDSDDDMYRIYCAGWQRKGSLIPRCIGHNTKDDDMKVGCFNCYGPKIICSYNEMTHAAFSSRCIKTFSKKKTRKDIPLDVGPIFESKALDLRNRLLDFKLKNFDRTEYNDFIEQTDIGLGEVDCRVAQSIKPLLMLSIFDPDVKEFMRGIAEQQETQAIEQEMNTVQGQIFIAYLELSKTQNNVSSSDIADKLNETIKDEKKKFKSNSIGMFLKPMGFKIHRTNSARNIIPDVELVEELLKRFVLTEDRQVLLEAYKNIVIKSEELQQQQQKLSLGEPSLDDKTQNLKTCIEMNKESLTKEQLTEEGFEITFLDKCIEQGIIFVKPNKTVGVN